MNPIDDQIMHGSDWEGGVPVGWIMQEKLDGIFVRWTGEQLVTRGGAVLDAPLEFTRGLPAVRLDCELYAGPGRRVSHLSNVIRWRHDSPRWNDCWLVAFDLPARGLAYKHRHDILLRGVGYRHAVISNLGRCKERIDLLTTLAGIQAKGGEGLMVREPSAPYTPGRTHTLLKVKREVSAI